MEPIYLKDSSVEQVEGDAYNIKPEPTELATATTYEAKLYVDTTSLSGTEPAAF